MKRSIAFLLIFFVLILSGDLYARKKGAELEILKKDGQLIRGELIAVKKDSLLLMESDSGVDVDVNIDEISFIKIRKGTKWLLGGGLGYLCGMTVVALFGRPYEVDWTGIYLASIIFGIPGFLLGALAGSTFKSYETIQIEGKSDTEIKNTLEELRKKARVPNFQ